jgi:uncharacterized protein (DUF302 family)
MTKGMKKSIVVEHVSVEIESSFNLFTFQLEKALGILAPVALKALGAVPASMARYLNRANDENELMLFNIFSHEDLTHKGKNIRIKHYQIGNPGIMLRMMAQHAEAGLYFPIQLLVYERPDGKTVVEYDLLSSLFERFNNAAISSDAMTMENNLIKIIAASDKEN